jgi:hypothetical protein
MALFSNKQEANLRVCIRMVEDAIAHLGHVADESRIDSADDLPAWKVEKGSAQVYVQLGVDGDQNVLKVTAPVMKLAAAVDEMKLFRYLLELNGSKVTGVAFGLRQEAVVLVAERPTADLGSVRGRRRHQARRGLRGSLRRHPRERVRRHAGRTVLRAHQVAGVTSATASISTSAPLGRPATWTVARAGGASRKNRA